MPETKHGRGWLDTALAFIYFIAFEVVVYYGLSSLLLDPVPKNADNQQTVIVRNWNSFVYFFLLYAVLVIGTMLVLTSALPRQYQPLVRSFFWLSWLGLAFMLAAAFG
jgi:hypothetical protein